MTIRAAHGWLLFLAVNLICSGFVQRCESQRDFVCGRAATCKHLCEAAEDQCQGSWKEEEGEDTLCLLSYSTSAKPDSEDLAQNSGRIVSSNITYRIHKDVLSDLLHRYNQVKRLKSQGRLAGPPGLPPAEQQVLRLAVALAFPRITLALRLLWGATLPTQTVCCHQECHWEDMFREHAVPSLRSLLARSVITHEQRTTDPHACGLRPASPLLGTGHGLLGRLTSSLEQSGWQLVPWMRQFVGRLSWSHMVHVVWWALAPSLLVALDGVQVCSDQPMLALTIGCVAFAWMLADWRALRSSILDTTFSPLDRIICHLSSSLVVILLMSVVTGLAVGAWLPLLDGPSASVLLWLMIVGLPTLSVVVMHAAKGLHHLQHRPGPAWVRAELQQLRQQVSQMEGPQDSAAGVAMATVAAVGWGAAVAAEQARGTLPRGSTTDTDLLLETLEALLFPANWAEQHPRAQRAASWGASGQPQLTPRVERSGGGVIGTPSGGRRGGERGAVAAAVGDVGLIRSLSLHLSGREQAAFTPDGGDEGRDRPASDTGAVTTASGSGASSPAGRPVAAPGGEGPGSRGQTRARQAAAQAAFEAIHWPPPLDLPAWLDDAGHLPHAFRCPITLCLMREPTQASSGVTYERAALLQWLSKHRVDPVTHVPIKRHRLTPNLNLRHMIEEWVTVQVAERAASKVELDDD